MTGGARKKKNAIQKALEKVLGLGFALALAFAWLGLLAFDFAFGFAFATQSSKYEEK